jgi:hypothetical protein
LRRCLVIGCGPNVWSEVAEAEELCEFDAVICVKLAGVFWPRPFYAWATLHPEFMPAYEAKREARGYPKGYQIVAPIEGELGTKHRAVPVDRRLTYRWPGMNASGSSGLYGVKIALDDGFDRVVCAGIPMTDEPHFARSQSNWQHRGSFIRGWELALPRLRENVRSMSGWTREKLGAPTPQWLAG